MKRLFLVPSILIIASCLQLGLTADALAQFLALRGGNTASFVQQVQRFEDFRRSHNLDTIRGWKYYKRWEQDQFLHSGAFGQLSEPESYHQAVLEAAEIKQRTKSIFDNDIWSCIGPFNRPTPDPVTMQNGMGRVNCIAFHPTDSSIYYVGVAQGGVWKTTDAGQNWKALTDNLPIIRISDIAIDPSQPNTIYIALGDYEYLQFGMLQYGRKRNTYYGLGIYKSTDAGEHWQATGLGRSLTQGEASLICKILVNPKDSRNIVAAGTTGFFSSTDAGISWQQRDSSLAWDLQMDPRENGILYATSGHLLLSGIGRATIMKSSDFGLSWRKLNSGIPERDSVERIKIAISRSNPNVLYAIGTNKVYAMFGFYRSTDAGESWHLRCTRPNVLDLNDGNNQKYGQGSYDLCMEVNALNPDQVYVGGINVWASTDGGQSFNPASYWTGDYGPSIHADHHFMKYSPLTKRYFVCNDGGVVSSQKINTTPWDSLFAGRPLTTEWSSLTRNMSISSFYRVSTSHALDNRVAAGAQDNSTAYLRGAEFRGVIGGDGMDNWICPGDTNAFIGSYQNGAFSRTLDNVHWENFTLNEEKGDWTAPIVGDYYSKNDRVIAAAVNVYSSTDKGLKWTALSNFPVDSTYHTGQEACALALCAQHTEVMMLVRRIHIEQHLPTSVYRTSDGGASWQNVTKGLPDSLFITSIEIADDNPELAWLSCAGLYSGVKVYRTSDGGQHWQNISYDLPNLPVNVVRQVPESQHHLLLVGTDVGIFCINDLGTHWISYSRGLPNVIISDIDFNPATTEMYCATFGRGLWKAEIIYDLPIEVGVHEQTFDSELSLFPSPLSPNAALHLRWSTEAQGNVEIDISSDHGKLLQTLRRVKSGDTLNEDLNLSLAPGAYFVRCRCGTQQSLQKLIVE